MVEKFKTVVTSTADRAVTSTSSSTAGTVSIAITSVGSLASPRSLADIESAVFSHIQAVRTLGRSEINTAEIAQALSLPQELVIAAVARLRGKGVRVAG